MNYNYLNIELDLYFKEFLKTLPSLLLSIFVFIIFYIIAEYYKTGIIKEKKKNEVSSDDLYNISISEHKSEIQLKTQMEVVRNEANNDLIFYQLSWIVYYSIIIFGLIFAFVNLGFNVATIIALLSSIGFALALAMQKTLQNIVSGIYISTNELFRLGDVIALNSLGNENYTFGKIIDFNLYYTTVLNKSDNLVSVIPNSTIQNNILTNLTISKINFSDN